MFTKAGDITKRFSLWNLPGSRYYQFVASMDADEVPELTLDSLRRILLERSGRTDIRLHDLSWKLAAELAGASEELLDTYEAERMPVADVLGLSTALHQRNFRTTLGPMPTIHQLDIRTISSRWRSHGVDLALGRRFRSAGSAAQRSAWRNCGCAKSSSMPALNLDPTWSPGTAAAGKPIIARLPQPA